jgi:hypothetical protein
MSDRHGVALHDLKQEYFRLSANGIHHASGRSRVSAHSSDSHYCSDRPH